MKEMNITYENIEKMVIVFYKKTLEDKQLAPYFIKALGKDIENKTWQEHIELLSDFWATMVIDEYNEYNGTPYSIHDNMGIEKRDFARWMKIFSNTLDEIYEDKPKQKFLKVALIMKDSLSKRLKL